ncbi:MAG: Tetratricopeptide 2 repeat protein [Myxococcales bacterium]|nr:Tetratricopeptide 2 repeat protein [Myxococcales bacterium]
MIEATCAACGTLNRFAEGDVPPGAKFIACSSCKSRVSVPGRPTVAGVKPPATPVPPIPKTPPPIPGAKPTLDLADLPAPKRSNPLAGAGEAKPAPKSPLAELATKPAPKSPFADLEADLPAPKLTGAKWGDRDDELAPRTVTPPAPMYEAPIDMALGKSGAADAISDLPAPKPKPVIPSIKKPEPKKPADTMMGPGITDLPAPKSMPKPSEGAGPPQPMVSDLSADISDLPAPKAMPKPAKAPANPAAKALPPNIVDLPAPKPDLLTPKVAPKPAAKVPADLATPRTTTSGTDLPAPKGFFDDLPQPAFSNNKADLPAPKGFFDDLPQPALSSKPDLPAPKGFFDDLPQPALSSNKADLPAPKGFFDDLPQPALKNNKPDLPAPKGFFEDIPQPALTNKPNLPAPKGFFDNLPQRARAKSAAEQQLEPVIPAERPQAAELTNPAELDLGTPDIELPDNSNQEIELQGPSPELDLGLLDPEPPAAPAPLKDEQFDDLDLSKPSASGGIRFEKAAPSAPKPPKTPAGDGGARTPLAPQKGAELSLDLADEQPSAKAAKRQVAAKVQHREERQPVTEASRKKRSKLVLGAVLGLAVLGGGGFVMYQRHQAAEARAEEIATQLASARKALHAPEPNHWQQAAAAAKAVLEQDETNADALAIGGEASIAGALETGLNAPARIAQGRAMLNAANRASLNTPALEVPRALDAITSNQPDRAITKLTALLAKSPNDAYLLLYLGWAQLAKGDGPNAIKSFDAAIAASPNVKISALYSRGKARLVMADLAGARADFATVLETSKDHVAAQVGLAAAGPPSQSSQREADLLAILARKDIATADQRAVVQAWTLAADIARGNGRLDVARERYHKALAITALDVQTLTGLAATELRDNKLDVALDLITKALTQRPDDVDAQLVASELAIRQGKLKDAETRLAAIAGRQPPVAPVQEARMHLLKGKLLEARGDDEGAVEDYVVGAKVAGELDLAPTMAAVTKLSLLAKKDPTKAQAYHDRADQLLSSLAERAQDDPQMSMTIGIAYLDAGDATKAEAFLRRTVEMRSNDVEAKLGLARALVKLERIDDAIAQLQNALQIDATRIDISLELARTFEAAGRNADAIQAYDKLLSSTEVPLQARVHAGRFFARIGDLEKAVAQADPILKAEPDNSAGHYLKGERALMQGKLDDARHELIIATNADPDPYYYDAAGRADEASLAGGDTKYIEQALHQYDLSHQGLATLFNPLAGMGRMYILRKEFDKALKVLLAANALKPNDQEVMYLIGVCYQALGAPEQKKAAIDWLKNANKVKSTAETSWRLGQLFEDPEINQPAQAIAALTSAIRLAEDQEKKTGTQVEWLTEAYGLAGNVYFEALHEECASKPFYEKFLARHPDPKRGVVEAARKYLSQDLKVCR